MMVSRQFFSAIKVIGSIRLSTRKALETNHLNTPRLIADSTGTTVWRWDNQEQFGSDVPNNNPSGAGAFEFPLRFPGQYFDRETNLAYNYFRDYDAGIGRYVQSDPIGLAGGLNTYAYVKGTPILWVDDLGLLGSKPPPSPSTIQCDGKGNYEVVNNNKGCDFQCTKDHEDVHVQDWKARYGATSCQGKAKGYLPLGGAGYDEFLRKSECKGYATGKACREALIREKCNCPDAKKGIERDKDQMEALRCAALP
jgi:RHS repeat-associated protein